jgi:hypothetical protein
MNKYDGYKWIKVKHFNFDASKSWEENYHALEQHHIEETTFLIEELKITKNKMIDKKSYNLFLDDDPNRIPHKLSWIELPLVDWVIVRNYNDFVTTIQRDGIPLRVSFDHDLGDMAYKEYDRAIKSDGQFNYDNVEEKTGYHAAQWLANYCVDNKIPIPQYYIHTRNPMGAMNIFSILESARKVMEGYD